MITYKQPDYGRAQEMAYDTIINSHIKTLPINLNKIINQFKNLHLQKYSVFAWNNGLTMNEVCNLFDSEEGCLWRRCDNEYLIFYNDSIESKERIRFTIAHEIGHYVLGHHESSDKTKISRYTLATEEDEVFEKEANYFAKRLLAPLPLIYDFLSMWSKISANLIMDIFDVSFTVSNYIIKDLHRAQRYGISKIPHEINDQFLSFIKIISNALWCNNCNFNFSSTVAIHCPICGQKNLIDDSMYIIRRLNKLIYTAYELDDEMRVIQCPRCNNEDVSGNYCKVCAEYLFNVCTGFDEYDNSDSSGIYWHEHTDGCENAFLDGNARYCHKCGSTSSFFEEGLLTPWNKQNKKELVDASGNILQEINTDDLPF